MSSTTTIKTGDLYVYRDEDRNAIAVSKACVGPNGGFVGTAICSMNLPNKYKTQSEINLLAQLFTAAPELLDLLSRAAEASSPNDDVCTAWWEARNAAIAKAGGAS